MREPSLLSICVLAITAMFSGRRMKAIVASLLIALVGLALVGPAIGGQTSYQYEGQTNQAYACFAAPYAYYVPAPQPTLATASWLPAATSLQQTTLVDAPSRREINKAKRKSRQWARAQANLQTTVATVGTATTTGIAAVPMVVPTAPAVTCEGCEAH